MGNSIMSKEIFIENIEKLEIAFRMQLKEKELKVYYAHLKSLPVDILATNIDNLIKVNKFFPRVSEIWGGYVLSTWEPCDPEKQKKAFEDIFK